MRARKIAALMGCISIHPVSRAGDLFSPRDIETLKSTFSSVALLGVVIGAVWLALRFALRDGVKKIRTQNTRSRQIFLDAVSLYEVGNFEQAKSRFLEAKIAFDRQLFRLEQALSVLGAADSANKLGENEVADILYEDAKRILQANPVPEHEPIDLFVSNRRQISRHSVYKEALARCHSKRSGNQAGSPC